MKAYKILAVGAFSLASMIGCERRPDGVYEHGGGHKYLIRNGDAFHAVRDINGDLYVNYDHSFLPSRFRGPYGEVISKVEIDSGKINSRIDTDCIQRENGMGAMVTCLREDGLVRMSTYSSGGKINEEIGSIYDERYRSIVERYLRDDLIIAKSNLGRIY